MEYGNEPDFYQNRDLDDVESVGSVNSTTQDEDPNVEIISP